PSAHATAYRAGGKSLEPEEWAMTSLARSCRSGHNSATGAQSDPRSASWTPHQEEVMNVAMLVLALAAAPSQAEKEVTAAEKKAFLELLAKLPTKGEFFTDEAVQKAAPHTRVLLALTEKDVGKNDIYPFLALSRGLLDRKEQREYGVKYFVKIAHPTA